MSTFIISAFKNISKDDLLSQKKKSTTDKKSTSTAYLWMQTKEIHLLGFRCWRRKRTLTVEPQLQARRAVKLLHMFTQIGKKWKTKDLKKERGSYISAMASGGLRGQRLYLLPVQLSSSAVILGVGCVSCAPVLVEKCNLPQEEETRQSTH